MLDGILDSDSSYDGDDKELTERQVEDRADILLGSLPLILKKLEEKGAE
jgi:hypothetical protein